MGARGVGKGGRGAETEEVGEDMVGSTAGRCQIWGRDVRKIICNFQTKPSARNVKWGSKNSN